MSQAGASRHLVSYPTFLWRSIGVATGGHSRAELAAAGADATFDDLSNTEAVLRWLAAP